MNYGDGRLPPRYWDKVAVADNGCWMWTASTDPYGYGYFGWDGKLRKAHRVMMQAVIGEWPGERRVLHSCDTPGCVNPAHLRLGTDSDNMQDKIQRGRDANLNKTHCPHGHEYTPENTSTPRSNGQGRKCKTCNRERMRRQ